MKAPSRQADKTLDSDEIPLVSADRYAEYAFLSPSSGRLRILSGDPLQTGLTFRGLFGRMDIGPVALYRNTGEIFVQSKQFTIRIDPVTSASVSRGPENVRTLEITPSTGQRIVLTYTATPRWNSDLEAFFDFTWTEEEHFDFGLRVANVINEGLNSFFAD